MYREARGMVPEAEEKGEEKMGVEFRDFGLRTLERAAMEREPAIRADLQKEAIFCCAASKV